MKTNPIVTVAMPVYNPNISIRYALLSLLNQDFKSWELIIIDDGSKDNIDSFILDIMDPRIIVIKHNVNRGLAARLNECIYLAKGEYFARMDSDDVAYPTRLSKQHYFLVSNPSVDLLATRALVIGEDNLPKGVLPYRGTHDELVRNSWMGIYMPHPTWMGKTSWFKKYLYAEPATYFCEDQELLLRAHKDSRYETLNEILLAYRVRERLDQKKLLKTRKAILRFQTNFFWNNKNYLYCSLSALSYFIKLCNQFYRLLIGSQTYSRFAQPTEKDFINWKIIYKSTFSKY